MRHADAAPGAPGTPDALRPLTDEGRRRARERADVVVGFAPDLVLCSSARRATETLEAIGDIGGAVEVDDRIYEATAASLLLRLAELGPDVRRVAVIGHLPTIGQLADGLAGDGSAVAFAPAAIAVLRAPGPWSALRAGCATVVGYRP